MTQLPPKILRGVIAGGFVVMALFGFGGVAAAAKSPKTAPATSETPQQTLCGIANRIATYHGTNARRKLRRATVDPLKVVEFPCNFSADVRGIRLDQRAISLVAGGKFLRSIPLPNTGPVTLPELTQLIDDPSWIAETFPGVFELKASLVQEAGTTLNVEAPAVAELRIDNVPAVTVGGSAAIANFTGVTVESWDPKTSQPVTTPKFGRPFILYENTSHLNIIDSTMQYLGSDETSGYGVSWRVGGSSGTVDHSIFQHNFFGVYTYQAAHVIFENSTFRFNTFYGIDPHTNSTDLTVTDNNVYGNLDHGIVFSRYVTNSVVSGNYVHGNKVNGIMMDFHSDGNVITKNVVEGNAQGIVMSGSAKDNIYGNTITNNDVGIRASHDGAELDNIHNNTITGGRIGIQLYAGATATDVTANVIKGPSSAGMVLDSPRAMVKDNIISDTPTAMKVFTATTVVGGTLRAQKIGIEVEPEGYASIRSAAVDAATPVSHAAGSVVELTDTAFSLPSTGSSLSALDIAGIAVVLFALLCEVLHLARGRSVKRLALTFDGGAPGGAVLERPIPRLSKFNVQFQAPTMLEPPKHAQDEVNDPVRRFRPDIEGLRAIAVVFVVLSHASLGLPGGFVGVDIFFVISGFLITQQLLRERERHWRTSFAQFYARRVRRILPAATVVTCATLAASYWLVSPLRFASIAKDAAASALFSVNWRLAAAGTNYFSAAGPPSPFQHYWSLSVEEQFYLIWPLLIAGIALLFRRKMALKWPLTTLLVAITAVSLWASIHVTQVSASYAYFGTHTRAWELATGALLAVWAPKLARLPRSAAAIMAWVGIAAMFWAAFALSASTAYPGWIAQVPVYGAALVIAAGCGVTVRYGPELLLRRSLFQGTGRLSYSLYLWHWPLLVLLPDFLGHSPSWQDRIAAIGVAVLLSLLTFLLVEDPVRRSNWLVKRPRRALVAAVTLISISLVVAFLVGSSNGGLTPTNRPFTTPELSQAMAEAYGGAKAHSLASALDSAARLTNVPADVSPPLGAVPTDFPAATQRCEVPDSASLPVLPCNQFGDPNGSIQAVLIGDSHAGMWLPAVSELASQNHWKLTFLAKSGCAIGDYPDLVDADFADRVYTECNTWRQAVIADVVRLHPAVVIVASEARPIAATEPTGLTTTFDALAKSSAKLIFLADTPNPVVNVPDCLAQHLHDVQTCNIPISAAKLQSAGRLAEIAGAEAGGAAVIDPTPWFCTDTVCPVIIQNTIVYMDASHITAAYGLLREPQLAKAVNLAMKQSAQQ